MPSAEASLVSLLTNGVGNPVAAIIGTRCYPDVLPQGVTYPAIRYQRISTARSQYRTLDGHAGYAAPRMQVDCFDLSRSAVITLGQAVYGWLEGFAGTVGGLRIDAISTEDEAGEFEAGIGPGSANVYRQRIDLFMQHAE